MAPISELLELICHPLSVRPPARSSLLLLWPTMPSSDISYFHSAEYKDWAPDEVLSAWVAGPISIERSQLAGWLTVHHGSSSTFRLWRSETQTRIYIREIVFQNSINLFIREILRSHGYARVRNPTSYTALYPISHLSITVLVTYWWIDSET